MSSKRKGPYPTTEPPVPVEPMPKAKIPSHCPRCTDKLRHSYGEWTCLMCGYVAYEDHSDELNKLRRTLFNSGTMRRLRYGGNFEAMKGETVTVRTQRINTRVVDVPLCPWCAGDVEMAFQSLSGKRKDQQEARYLCPSTGHRVSLSINAEGEEYWK